MNVWSFYEALGEANRDGLTPVEQQVAAICDLRQEVNSGGFDTYFQRWGGNTAPTALAGLRPLLGQPWELLLKDALALFEGPYPLDADQREDILDTLETDQALNELDGRFYELEATTDADQALTRALDV